METSVTFYQQCIKQILSEYSMLKTDGAETQLVFDDERLHYLVMWVGWQGYKRIHECAIHIDIVDGKIVIQWNDTEDLLEESLMEMGIPKSAIVLGMLPLELQENSAKELPAYPVAA